MDTLFFLMTLGCLAIVLFWYIFNEMKGADGDLWFIALRSSNKASPAAQIDAPSNAPSQAGLNATTDTAHRYHVKRGKRFARRTDKKPRFRPRDPAQ